jgi:predicted RNA-binding protein Jag
MQRTDCTQSWPSRSIPGYGALTAEDGHSVTTRNADTNLTHADIDGRLVGTAGQDLTALQALIEASITPMAAARRGH